MKTHNESIGAFDSSVFPKSRRFAEMLVGDVDESLLRAEAVEGQARVPKCATNGESEQSQDG